MFSDTVNNPIQVLESHLEWIEGRIPEMERRFDDSCKQISRQMEELMKARADVQETLDAISILKSQS